MTDYIEEYGDELEDIELTLRRAIQLLNDVRTQLKQGLIVPALRDMPGIENRIQAGLSNTRSLARSFEYEIGQAIKSNLATIN